MQTELRREEASEDVGVHGGRAGLGRTPSGDSEAGAPAVSPMPSWPSPEHAPPVLKLAGGVCSISVQSKGERYNLINKNSYQGCSCLQGSIKLFVFKALSL